MLKDFCRFCEKRRFLVIFTLLVTALVYGFRIFSDSITIDTDLMINTPGYMYNWLDIGRYGLIVTEKIFGVRWFNPYVNGAFAYVTINLFLLVLCYVFEYISKYKDSNNYYVFCCVFITHPIWVDQWIFRLQNFQIAFSILILAVALGMQFRWIKEGNPIWIVVSIPFMVWSFGSYQTNMQLYIAMGAAALFLYGVTEFKKLFFVCLKVVIPFIIAFIINQIIVNFVFVPSSTDYLSSQFKWGKVSVSECLNNISIYFKQVTGISHSYFYEYTYSILCVVIVFLVIVNWKNVKKISVWKWLAAFFVLIAPFIMTIVTASVQVLRSQYVLPFSCACILMYLASKELRLGILECIPKVKNGFRVIVIVFAIWTVLQQSNATLRLWYTDEIRYQQDVELLNEIMARIHEKEYSLDDMHVVVIGRRVAPLNSSCYYPTDVIGWSYFEMFTDTEPQYFYSTGKFTDFAKTKGIVMTMGSEEEINKAKEYAASMPSWPAQGSVDDVDGILVIKLSDV